MKSNGMEIQIPTIENYLNGLLDAFVLYKIKRYDTKGKKHLQTNAKYYLADVGLHNLLLGGEGDKGHILENAVFLELLHRGYTVHIGKVNTLEIDFVATRNGLTEYYQVFYDIKSPDTFARELAPYNATHDHNPKYFLTIDYPLQSTHNGVKIVSVFEWMVG